jgi:Rrf2 family iron-sulfur cluster assembly transcriptional regulator
MKMGTRARYGLHMMMQLACESKSDGPVDITTIAERTGLSRRYLEQLAIDLKKASLIKGSRGRRGGYLLAKAVDQIKIRDIVEATIGTINVVHCVGDPSSCGKSADCECRMIWLLVNEQIRKALGAYSLADLNDPDRLACIAEKVSALSRRACRN